MKRAFLTLALIAAASPALAADGPFVSLHNTNFVVLIAFLVFLGIVLYARVPAKIGALLDARAAQIESELAEARALREEAKDLLASYERKSRDVAEQSERIVASAKEEAKAAAEQAKADLKNTIARRLRAAEERIASAEAQAVREVREQAVNVAVAAAADLLTKGMNAEKAKALTEASLAEVEKRLH